ncbi:MAG: protein kinase [Polyangiaceae bacterium]
MELPARVGAFELTDLLGEGGMGAVYGGTADGVRVAVKVLKSDLALTDRERRRFLDEAAKMRRVSHPSIVPVLDAGTLPDGRPFLSMPRLEGETLAARLERGVLPIDEALGFFAELASAVTALHDAGLVHRDVKPENVFLTEGRAVLLDLGIAREVDGASSTTTMEGKTRGTPAYMAPERFFGAPATLKSDVYELAVVLYCMLVGRVPWDDPTDPMGRLHPAPPHERSATPRALSLVLLRALSTRPEIRPDNASAFAAEIARARDADGAPESGPRTTAKLASAPPPSGVAAHVISAPPATEGSPSSATRSGRRMAVATLALVAVAGAIGVGFRVRAARTTTDVGTASPTPASAESAAPTPSATAAPTDPPTPSATASSSPTTMPALVTEPPQSGRGAGRQTVPTPRILPVKARPEGTRPASSRPDESYYLDRH